MQSDDNPPGENPLGDNPPEVGETPTSPNRPRPLRREAMLNATERQRGAMFAVVCSFAGVGLGFGLSQIAATNNNCQHQIHVNHVRAAEPQAERSFAPAIPTYTWLGVEGHTAQFRDQNQQLWSGAIVSKVFPGSPAARAGLEAGNLITGIDGTPVVSFSSLIAAVRSHVKGEQVMLDFVEHSELGRQQSAPVRTTVELGEIAKRQLNELEGTLRRR